HLVARGDQPLGEQTGAGTQVEDAARCLPEEEAHRVVRVARAEGGVLRGHRAERGPAAVPARRLERPGAAHQPAETGAAAFLAVVFFAAAFLVVFLAAFFLVAGPRARRSASSSPARSRVIVSTSSPLRRLAFVSPSVTYGPNRPSRTVTWPWVTGSGPSSLSGALAAARPRCLGWAKIASASSSVVVNSAPSLGSERESVPFFRY